MIYQNTFSIKTSGRGMIEITEGIEDFIVKSKIKTGICNIFTQHTSASIIVCENADPSVRKDLEMFLSKLVPDGSPMFTHNAEGDDDMAAHLRTVLTKTDITIPISAGSLALGTWQGIYLWEHRYQAHHRRIMITAIGE